MNVDLNQVVEMLREHYPQYLLSMAFRTKVLLFDENGLPKVEARVVQVGHEVQLQVFEYDKKLPEKVYRYGLRV